MNLPIYLDNLATTRVDPDVLETMLPFFCENYGNAASRNHPFGWKAEESVEIARSKVATIIGAQAKEIVFTSGATESDNLAIKGVAYMFQEKGKHIITLETEHKAVLDTCKHLQKQGFEISYLPVQSDGVLDLDILEKEIRKDTILISIMAANNEIGVLQPIKKIGQIAKNHQVLFHTDAAQAVGKIPLDVHQMNIDLMSISGHKIYGPKGVGALYVRRMRPRVRLVPIIDGGGHERGFRSGTLNVPGVIGLGKACEIAQSHMSDEIPRILNLKRRLVSGFQNQLDHIYINGNQEACLPNTVNISFAFVEGESLLMGVNQEIAISSGSACTSASLEPSYVLKSLGLSEELAHTSLRFGIGRFNTEEEIDYVVDKVSGVVKKLRDMSPLYEMVMDGIDLDKFNWKRTD